MAVPESMGSIDVTGSNYQSLQSCGVSISTKPSSLQQTCQWIIHGIATCAQKKVLWVSLSGELRVILHGHTGQLDARRNLEELSLRLPCAQQKHQLECTFSTVLLTIKLKGSQLDLHPSVNVAETEKWGSNLLQWDRQRNSRMSHLQETAQSSHFTMKELNHQTKVHHERSLSCQPQQTD